jgi:hypothetical protein
LRDVMGFDLDRIREILRAEDGLAQLRREVQKKVSVKRRREIIREAADLNRHLRRQVREKMDVLQGFLAELEERATHIHAVAGQWGVDLEAEVAEKLAQSPPREPEFARDRTCPPRTFFGLGVGDGLGGRVGAINSHQSFPNPAPRRQPKPTGHEAHRRKGINVLTDSELTTTAPTEQGAGASGIDVGVARGRRL